jgi:hypothetical protein
MRATLADVRKHPKWLIAWWIDLPFRRRIWWSDALWAEGEGWLRWKIGWRSRYSYDPPDFEQWAVYPPLRRLWIQIHWIMLIPLLRRREHLSWEELAPAWECLRADPERKKELWR